MKIRLMRKLVKDRSSVQATSDKERSMARSFQPEVSRSLRLLKRIYQFLSARFFAPLLATLVGAVFISRIANSLLGPSAYKIYVVGNMQAGSTSATNTVARQIYEAFDARQNYFKDFGGIPVKVVAQNDQGDPGQARQVAERIARQPDTLLVIGHIASSQTKEALPIYLNAVPPIPVILTTETNPALVPVKLKKHAYRPVFRLAPTDKEQARVAAEFIAKQASGQATGIWVVEDVSGDTVYSSFLSAEFIRHVQQLGARVVLWSTNLSTPGGGALRGLNVGWVFFAGRWPAALVLIRELKAIYGSRTPGIVLSDACAHDELIAEGGNDVDGVFVTYPMTVSQRGEADYSAFGVDASKIVEALFQSVDNGADFDEVAERDGGLAYRFRALMGISRVEDARRVLSSLMQEAEETRQVFVVSHGQKIQFGVDDDGEDGVRVDPDAAFHIWRVNNKAFADFVTTD